jgi:ankyrin repeat protein
MMECPEFTVPLAIGKVHPYYGNLHNELNNTTNLLNGEGSSTALNIKDLPNQLKNACLDGKVDLVRNILGLDLTNKNGKEASRDGLLVSSQLQLVNIANTHTGMVPLHYAASRGHYDIVELLLDEVGAEVDPLNNEKETPLLKACFGGHLKVAQLLIQRGANVNHRDKEGWSSLHNSVSKGYFELVSWLVEEARAQVNITSNKGFTPLITSATQGQLRIVKYLVEIGRADINIKDANDQTAYAAAALNNHILVCLYLEDLHKLEIGKGYLPHLYHNTYLYLIWERERSKPKGLFDRFTDAPKFDAQYLNKQDGRDKFINYTTSQPLEFKTQKPDNSLVLPQNFDWLTNWEVDFQHSELDFEGWEYSATFDEITSDWENQLNNPGQGGVRRRLWVRLVKLKHLINTQ